MGILRGGSLLAFCMMATVMALPTDEKTRALQEVSTGTGQFSNALFQKIAETKPSENLVCSPLSAAVVLAMAAYGARGTTYSQLENALHLPVQKATGQTGYQALIDTLNNVADVELRLANKVFINNQFSVKPSYEQLTQTSFRSTSERVNFADAQTASDTINAWCRSQTNNRIDKLIKPNDVNADTALVLLNAVYFKGNWKKQFKASDTSDRDFHVDRNTVKNVATMYKRDRLRYGELPELKAKFVEIPYKGEQMSMVIIVPDEVDGLPAVESKLQHTPLTTVLSQGYEQDVKLYLPKFKVESTIDLKETLEKLDVTDMFDSRANFNEISSAPLFVSKVIQKAFIEVNEEGSEAAAVTGLVAQTVSLVIMEPEPQEIHVDRPFFYMIVKIDRDNHRADNNITPLFQGHVNEPKVQ